MKTKNRIWSYPIIVIGFILFLLNSCKKELVPIFTTSVVFNITATTSTSGGNITDKGSSEVTTCGVCWSEGTTPTIADNKTSDIDSMLLGDFRSNIRGLNGSTTYFVRAYATNNSGTGYGKTLSFTTLFDRESVEKKAIQNYINNNPNLTFQLKPSGLYYFDVIIGTGPSAETHDTAYVKYTGTLLDGTVIGTNIGKPDTLIFPVNVGYVIAGIDEGITYMKEGGKAKMLIFSFLAYGSYGYMNIPGYTPLLFDIELVKVKKGP